MVAQVIFFKTELEGQVELGRVMLDDGKLSVDGPDWLGDAITGDLDGEGAEAIHKAMRLAPERFDGAYLRAEYVEGVGEGGPGSGHHGHKGIPGRRGGSISSGGVPAIVGNPDDVARIESMLEGIPESHLAGLETISTEIPGKEHWVSGEWSEGSRGGYWRRKLASGEESSITGLYINRYKTLHVHPGASDAALKRTLHHEIGHHVTRKSVGWIKAADSEIIPEVQQQFSTSYYGLRPYSLTNGKEFLADSYTVWTSGSQDQWQALNGICKRAAGDRVDLERLFGPKES